MRGSTSYATVSIRRGALAWQRVAPLAWAIILVVAPVQLTFGQPEGSVVDLLALTKAEP